MNRFHTFSEILQVEKTICTKMTAHDYRRSLLMVPFCKALCEFVGKGRINVAFVRPSICLFFCQSVAYIANNSRTQRPSVPKLEWRFSTLDATRTPVSRSNGQRSGLQTGGGIPCRPNSAATQLVTSGKGGGKCVCPRLSVCLSVSKITQKRVHGFGWNVASLCRQMSGHGRTD